LDSKGTRARLPTREGSPEQKGAGIIVTRLVKDMFSSRLAPGGGETETADT
jgi:hypothetical protein